MRVGSICFRGQGKYGLAIVEFDHVKFDHVGWNIIVGGGP